MVSKIDDKSIHFKDKTSIKYDLSIWCGGIKKSCLTEKILSKLNINDNKGLPVNKYLQISKINNVFAIGDCANSGFPPTAQVAYQQGEYLARRFNNNFNNNEFVFNNQGQIGYIGMKKVFVNCHI